MFDLNANETSDLHPQALPCNICAALPLCQAQPANAPLGLRARLAIGGWLVRAGQKLQQRPMPQPDPSPTLFITL
ncbi:MAG TPA: hypothetical protein PKM21_16090 [Anaerolineales bacterium]|nr:hypothetical protein [Anaerolineales bacterium]